MFELLLLAGAAGNRGAGIDDWNFRPIMSTWSAGLPSSEIEVGTTGGRSFGAISLAS